MSTRTEEGQRGHILIVDDSPADLQGLVEILANQGYAVHSASEGEPALQFARSAFPDLILLNVSTPGLLDGYQVCRFLKADERTRDIPVIFTGAETEIRDKAAGFSLGAADHIAKPFHPDEVLARVRTLLALRAAQKELAAQHEDLRRAVAERQQAEASLQESQAHMQALLDNLPVELWERDNIHIEKHTMELARVNARLRIEIAERRRAEDELRQTNRMLKILSECNQTVIRAAEEDGLLQQICRNIAELGGYPLVWVGYAENDAVKTVRPVAHHGAADEYLDIANISWADNASGGGPTGTAIRSGRPCVARDIRTDPNFAPWREAATRRGYASSIALPLRDDEHVFGALNIYAAQSDVFHFQEVDLLMELAGDLAFGITALRARAERQRAEEALRESEERYRDLFNGVPVGIFRSTPEGRFLDVNNALAAMFGFPSREAMSASNAADLYMNPEDRRTWQAALAGEGIVRGMETEMRRCGGTPIWVRNFSRIVRNDRAPAIFYEGIVEDITERRRAEIDLRHRADELAAITRVSREITQTPDLREVLTSIARHAAELSGSDGSGMFTIRSDGRLYVEIGYGVSEAFLAALNAEGVPPGVGAIGRATVERHPTQITDTLEESGYPFGPIAGIERIRAILAVPMLRGDTVIGGFVLWHRQPRHFTEEETTFLQALAQQCVNAVENARLFEETKRRADEMTALYHTAIEISGTVHLPDLLWSICDRATKLIGVDKGGLYLYDETNQELELVVSYNLGRDFTGTRLKLGEGVSGRVVQTGEPLIVNDYSQWDLRAKAYEGESFTTVVGVPLKSRGRTIGAVTLAREMGRGVITPGDEHLLNLFAQQAAMAIENAGLLESERKQLRLARTLQEVGALLTAQMRLEDVFENLFDLLTRVIPYDSVSIQLLDTEGQMFLAAGRGFPDWEIARRNVREVSRQRPVDVWLQQKVMVISDTLADNRWLRIPGGEYIHSWVGAALIVRGEVIGALTADSATPNTYRPADGETIAAFANQAAVAIANARMVTELKRAETDLRESEEEYRTLVEQLPAIIYTQAIEEPNPIVYVSPQIEALLGYAPAEWLAAPDLCLQLIHPDDYKRVVEENSRTNQTGEPFNTEYRLCLRDGRTVWVQDQAVLIRDGAGRPRFWQGVILDITERKLAEDALRRRASELESLVHVASTLRKAQTRGAMLPLLIDMAASLFQADSGALFLREEPGLILAATYGDNHLLIGQEEAIGDDVCWQAALRGQSFFMTDFAASGSESLGKLGRKILSGMLSCVCVPLKAADDIIGVLLLAFGDSRALSRDEIRLLSGIAEMAGAAIHRVTLHEATQHYAAQLVLAYDTTLDGWARALELRDEATEGHTRRVTELTLRLARALGIADEAQLANIRRGAILHDIGKVGVPDSILLKPGPLTDSEREMMRNHPRYAYTMLSPIEFLRPALDIPRYHHEKWDGSGYPFGLKGEQTPLAARIFAVADVWDAITSDRPYRTGWLEEKARAYLQEEAGRHFDPNVVEVFLREVLK